MHAADGGWGDNLWGEGDLAKAVAEGLTNEATITASTRRTLMQKMKVGLFDAPEDSPWATLGAEALNSSGSQRVAYEAALQGMVTSPKPRHPTPALVRQYHIHTLWVASEIVRESTEARLWAGLSVAGAAQECQRSAAAQGGPETGSRGPACR